MSGEAASCGALGEAVVFLRFFEDLPDPRQRAEVIYPLDEILLLCLLEAIRLRARQTWDAAESGQGRQSLVEFVRQRAPFDGGGPAFRVAEG